MPANTLVLIDRERIQFSTGGKILTFALSPLLIKDLEIVDKKVFLNEVGSFAQKNQIVFGETLILLSESVCFIDEGGSLQSFTSTLPFENPAVASLGGKSVGTNRDLYEVIVELVGSYGGEVKSVAPIFLSKETFGVKNLDESTIKFIRENENIFTKGYFDFNIPAPQVSPARTKPKTTPLTIWLVGTFIVLIIIFTALLIIRS
ncbi:hypothetical protein A2210_03330 [Candidatus Woesebacteria bacterium RIFOXYA1_FULL_40_18]|uniref:Uncharacterized protein n=5 Tax=Candidatus Woeseibacteriota TaxID=1752722 RepID=A0A0G0UUW8_9BACT|nr:MAG: hypothetical protein UT72_C0005G0012 [Candidatus Woesebacteria bacterium GW2011_GWB1_40_101]KKR63445.1 MAG: hypothetical protein UU03_C0004G0016 [Candidatus Woesebacteria bacterium GW2011_GWA1_40_45]OGM77197.1 MAG: hypothetical protein A2210_03330 [Candidatus Woesebacteria bacterium RIFOXYA1_FULL_40_18]OGM79863.1 MAG: hypothetical protein A2361_02115 [Candidatus Woesebacteria bacterium RIFOXYB1_FULL_40_26]OGM88209.1 MAG: hypothetical protein A2614_01235 [Candidatus Woesebacteria bacteri